jgi:two-component system, sensor histidine kinase and response regulator
MPRLQVRARARGADTVASPHPPRPPADPAAAAFELACDAMLVLSRDRTCVAANRAAHELIGATTPLVGRRLSALSPTGLDRAVGELMPTAGADGVAHAGEFELDRPGMPPIGVGLTVTELPDGDRCLVTLRDHDERNETRATLDRLQRERAEAQTVGGFGHWEWDVETDAVEWSDELHELCGLQPGTVTTIGDVRALFHPDDAPRVAGGIEEARAIGGGFVHQFRVVRGDGVIRLFESRGQVVRDERGAAVRMFGTAQDITDRHEAELDRRHLSTFLDSSADAVSTCSLDGIFETWNRGAEKLYGYAADEVIGEHVSILMPNADGALDEEYWRRTALGEQLEPFETVRLTKDGRAVTVAVTLSPITDGAGTIVGVGAIGRDMTEQRRTREELAIAHEAAVEASRAKSEFMANMNHELRTPLNGVLGVSGLLLDTDLDEEQREYVEALRVSGESLMAVIEEILDFSKIEAGRLEVEAHPFELRTLVEEVCSMVAVSQPARAVEVIASVPTGAPNAVWGDRKRVRQILTNLTNNAVKFTEAGEVRVEVSWSPGEGEEGTLRFEVVDTGIGIDPRAQETIFESFSQADGSTTRRFGGTGLGLTIAKQLVTLMGGEIGLVSSPGEGSTFFFTVPSRVAEPARSESAPPALRGTRVLIVDDKATNRRLLVEQLSDWGLAPHAEPDLAGSMEALRAAAASGEPYGLVLVDYRLAGRLGDEVVAATRADPANAGIVVVMMVAARDAHTAGAIDGVDGIIAKPMRQAQLYRGLIRAVSREGGLSELNPDVAESAPGGRRNAVHRVLVVEDNEVNQLVAVRLLEQRGLIVDVAVNGREAIEMHATQRYDAIFMDCQMPELDGYDATREIRRREGAGPRTPIIAMTASTMPGDTERCIAAGMDYHTGKPTRPAGLDYILALTLG